MISSKKWRTSPSVPVIYQSEESECGIACIAMLLGYMGGNADINRLRWIYQSTRGGIGVNQLIKFASMVGIRLIPMINIRVEDLEADQLPCIGLWKNEHYVVIAEVANETIVVHDPAVGFIKLRIADAAPSFGDLILSARKIDQTFEADIKQKEPFKKFIQDIRLNDVGAVFITISLSLVLLASIYQIGSAQIQDVFFDWIVQMGMAQWSIPLAYTQIGIGFLAGLTLLVLSLLIAKKFSDISLEWNTYIYRRLLRLPESYFLDRRSGDIIAKFNNVDQILKSGQASIVNMLVAWVNLVVLFIILGLTAGSLLLIVLLAVSIALWLTIKLMPAQLSMQEMTQQAQAYSEKALYDIISDFEQIRIEGRENYYLEKINTAETRRIINTNDLNLSYSTQSFWLSIIDSTTSMLILIIAAFIIMRGDMTLGQYAAVDLIVGISLSPLMNISGVVESLQGTKIAFARLADIVSSPLDRRYGPSAAKATVSKITDSSQQAALQLQGISYKYSLFSQNLFQDLALTADDYEFPLLIDGAGGSGKSTLAKLIAGRLHSNTGEVVIDGQDLGSFSSRQLNKSVVLIDGNPYTTSGSVLNNMLLGTGAKLEDVIKIGELLGINRLPLYADLSRQISESAKELSTGELVLIQLVRNILRKPTLIVLDGVYDMLPGEVHEQLTLGLGRLGIKSVFISSLLPPFAGKFKRYTIAERKLVRAGGNQ